MEYVKISMVVPIYGVERYIADFLESVFSQSYPSVQYVFVNDGSLDSSVEILTSMLSGKYSYLEDKVLLINRANGGLPSARAAGMEYADGDYVWHLDPDDRVDPEALWKIADAASRTEADVIYFNYYTHRCGNTDFHREKDYDEATKGEFVRQILNHRSCGCIWNKCVRRSLYESAEVSFAPASYGEDIFLVTQLIVASRSIVHLDEALYHYRKDNPYSISKKSKRVCRSEIVQNYMALYALLDERYTEDEMLRGIYDDIFIRVGWYSIIYGLGLWKRPDFRPDRILRAPLRPGAEIGMSVQLLLKFLAAVCCRLN